MTIVSELTVYVWNVKDGLGDPTRAASIAEKVAQVNPDIAIFPEGTKEHQSVMPEAARILTDVGALHVRPYDDIDGRRDRHSLVALARPEFGKPEIDKGLGRSTMVFAEAEGFTVAGMHGFDRHGSWPDDPEEARKRQMRVLLGREAFRRGGPAIIMGDLNTMHKGDPIARKLQLVKPLADRLPSQDPGMVQTRLERLGSLAQRLCSMAAGDMLLDIRRDGFYDADSFHQPTMNQGPLAVQLDHILLREAGARIFTVHPHDGLSDHHAISATVVPK